MKTDCTCADSVSAFVDGEIHADQAGRLRNHLTSCDHCREIYERFRATDNRMALLPEIEPSGEFDREFWRKIDAIEEKRSRWSPRNLFPFWRPALAATAACMLLAGVFIFDNAPKDTALTADDAVIAENLELLEDYEIVRHLDFLENWTES